MAAGNKLAIAAHGDADRSAAAAHQRRVDVLPHDLASDYAPGDVLAARDVVHHREQDLLRGSRLR